MALNEQMQKAIQEDIADTRSKRERIDEQMGSLKGAGRFAGETAVESIPGVSEGIAVKNVSRDLKEGDYIGAGIEAVAGLAGLAPAGDVVAKTIRKNKSPIRKLFDKLPEKERNALPPQPDKNRIFGYHGTARSRERDEPFFDINFARKNDQFLGEGFYFTLDPKVADEYANLRAFRDFDIIQKGGKGKTELMKHRETGEITNVKNLMQGKNIEGNPLAMGQNIGRFDLSNLEKPYVVKTEKQRKELKAKIPQLKKEGYDSILFADFKDRSKQIMVFPENMDKINSDAINYAQGGTVMKKQMELFEPVEGAFDEGGLMQEGGTVDPESGNEVPVGSTQEEVRDDIPAQLSEGEFVFPADVVRYIGLEKLMQMRQEAKRGLEMMDKMGQMGNSDEAVIPDDVPFDMSDLDMEDDGVLEFQTGGFVQPQGFTGIAGYQPSQFTSYTPQFTPYTPVPMPTGQTMAQQYTPPTQQFTPTVSQQTPTFEQLTGAAQPSPGGYDEMRTYVNDAGMEMQIPFKDGKPIYPIPEGYKVKGEAVDTTTDVKTETTQTAAPEQQDSGDEPSDPFAGKNTVRLGGEVYTGKSGFVGDGVRSRRTTGEIMNTQQYAVGTASSATKPTSGIVAGIKDTFTGITNRDQMTLTNKDGVTVAMSKDLYEEIIADKFGVDRQEMLDNLFEQQKQVEKELGDNYSKDVDNQRARELAKDLGVEYKGQSTAELRSKAADLAKEAERKALEAGAIPGMTIEQRRELEQQRAIEAGEARKAEREAAAELASKFGINATKADGTRKSADELKSETAKAQQAARDAYREQFRREQASGSPGQSSSDDDYDADPSNFGASDSFAKGGLAQQMKQSGLASKK